MSGTIVPPISSRGFNGLLLKGLAGWVWGPFPKISEAMDGRSEAPHGGAARSVFWGGAPNPPLPKLNRLGPKQNGPHQSQNLTTKLANENLVEQLGVALALGGFHQRSHEAAEHLLALLRIFLALVLGYLIRHARQNFVDHRFQSAGVRHLLQAFGVDDRIYVIVLA